MSTDLTVMESNTLKKKSLSFFLIVKIDFVKTKEKAFQAWQNSHKAQNSCQKPKFIKPSLIPTVMSQTFTGTGRSNN